MEPGVGERHPKSFPIQCKPAPGVERQDRPEAQTQTENVALFANKTPCPGGSLMGREPWLFAKMRF